MMDSDQSFARITVKSEVQTPIASVYIVHFEVEQHQNIAPTSQDQFLLNLALTPRPVANANFLDRPRSLKCQPLGDLFFKIPEVVVEFASEKGDTTSLICELRRKDVESWLEESVIWSDRALENSLDVHCQRVWALMRQLAEEVSAPGFAHGAYVELICAQLGLQVSRTWLDFQNSDGRQLLAQGRIAHIKERIAVPGPAPTLAELAGLCGISVRHLTRSFRATFGCSIGRFIAEQRGELAKQLLAEDRSVKAVARDLGFTSPAAFTHAFRSRSGMTPTQFRQRLRKQ